MSKKINVLVTGEDGYIANQFKKYIEPTDLFDITMISVKNDEWKKLDFSKYDSIFHLAGIVHNPKATKEDYEKINYKLTIELAKKAKKEKIGQFLFFSTGSVYGDIRGKITQKTIAVPNNFYGKSKLKAEIELKKMEDKDFKICIVRPPMVYGKGCKGNYCLLSKLAKKIPIFPKVNNIRSMIYIENLCEFVKLLILNKESGLFFPQNKEYVNTSEMVKLIANENKKNVLIIKILSAFVNVGKHIPGKIGKLCNKAFGDWYYDMSISEYKTNYIVKGFEESIHDTEM